MRGRATAGGYKGKRGRPALADPVGFPLGGHDAAVLARRRAVGPERIAGSAARGKFLLVGEAVAVPVAGEAAAAVVRAAVAVERVGASGRFLFIGEAVAVKVLDRLGDAAGGPEHDAGHDQGLRDRVVERLVAVDEGVADAVVVS